MERRVKTRKLFLENIDSIATSHMADFVFEAQYFSSYLATNPILIP